MRGRRVGYEGLVIPGDGRDSFRFEVAMDIVALRSVRVASAD